MAFVLWRIFFALVAFLPMTAVGIDFGTSFLSVAVLTGGKPAEVVADADGNWQLPAAVNYSAELKPRVGDEALKQLVGRDPKGTVYDIKKFLGVPFSHVVGQKGHWSFPVAQGKKVRSEGKDLHLSGSEIAAELLKKLKETAESSIHSKASSVTISVPHQADSEQKNALIEASKLAGFSSAQFISDPVAAVLAYGLDTEDPLTPLKEVIVIDFGTVLRISYMIISSGIISVKESRVLQNIQAHAIDQQLINFFAADFKRKSGLDINESKRATSRLQAEVIRVKTVLSQIGEAKVQIEGLLEGLDLNGSITRARFEGMNSSLFSNASGQIRDFLEEVGANPTHIILSGGNCKIPRVQSLFQGIFEDAKVLNTINPTDVNAIGAAIHANILSERPANLKEIKTASSLPLSIGIGGYDGAFVPILPKGTVTPTKVSKQFSNSTETQTEFYLAIYEGEDSLVSNNQLLGHFVLSGLPPRPVGETIITVEFLVDKKDVLSVQVSSGGQAAILKFKGVANRKTVPREEKA